MITTLLVIWFALWAYKNFPRVTVKEHFNRKLKAGKIAYASLDFETFVAKDKREELRKEYDRLIQTIDAYQEQVNNKNNTKETVKLFEDKIAEVQESVKNMKEKLEDADRGIKLAEDTKDELHYQENLMREFIKREL